MYGYIGHDISTTRGKMMKTIIIFIMAVILTAPWVINAVKLSNCDFESNYKCEVVHLIGVVIPPASWITVWFDTDS